MPILLLLILLLMPAATAQESFSGVERVVAIGDIHGDYEAFLAMMRDTGLIDEKNRWSGGKTHLVQTGDIVDRGPDSRKVMDLLQSLEKQASKAGGRIHVLVGNHEVMNMYGDLRYTSAGEYAAFRTATSERARADLWEQEVRALPRAPSREERAKWEAAHPLGWVEHRMQFGSEGAYGRWLRSKNVMVRVNDSLFLHGGIGPKYAGMSLGQINGAIRGELRDVSRIKSDTSPVTDPEGPLWYRGLAQDNGAEAEAHLEKVLAKYGVKRVVIGHTPTPGAVIPRFGGRVLLIDTGLSAYYGSNRACLVLEGGKGFAIHRGEKVELPGAGGGEIGAYLKRVAALEKPGSALSRLAAQQ